MTPVDPNPTANAMSAWNARLAPFMQPDPKRSIWQLVSTAALFVTSWVLAYWSLHISYWLTLALALPTSFMLIRLFIIQHDLGHGSFLKSPRVAGIIGGILGVVTLVPYNYWRRTHAIHHATSGNLEHRGFGDINTLTITEYLARSPWGRFKYRLYRHPLVLFGVGAVLHFFVKHRIPTIVPPTWHRERRSILLTDLGLLGAIVVVGLLIGFKELALVHLPVALISCSMGVWLFYVQHQFEPTYWEHDAHWDYGQAALQGSSYYVLPQPFQWLTGNIGLHHIHHMNARIPNYRLPTVLKKFPELNKVTHITALESFKCISLTLWDEAEKKLVPFSKVRRVA
jgi:omega-6 fatty acid desaturase (delta-12 desaturase)